MGGRTSSWGVKEKREKVFDEHDRSNIIRSLSTLGGFVSAHYWALVMPATLC